MTRQSLELEKMPHVVVATPGRLAELIKQGTRFYAKHLKFLVLDEADRLFEPEFAPALQVILDHIPSAAFRQTLLFSATIAIPNVSDSLEFEEKLRCNSSFEFVQVSSSEFDTVDIVDQRYCFMPEQVKDTYLVHILSESKHQDVSTIIFVGTCAECQVVGQLLVELDIQCVTLHSKLNQPRRTAALGKFRSGLSKILVCTDVASRGLDIPEVELIINFDVPRNAVDYIHRIGRTARAGRLGRAVTLITQYDIQRFLDIEEHIGKKISEHEVKDEAIVELCKRVNPARRMAKLRLEEFSIRDMKQAKKRKISN